MTALPYKVIENCGPILLLLLSVVVSGLLDGRILAPQNLMVILAQSVPILMLALGAFIVLLTGGIDLSAGVAATLGGIIIAGRLGAGVDLVPALMIGLAAMASIGLINGLLVSVMKLPAFVATLASMSVIQGLVLLMAKQGVYVLSNPTLKYLGTGRLAGIPISILAACLVIVIAQIVMRQTRFGLRVYATGSDAIAAGLADISTRLVLLQTYVVGSVFALLAAVTLIARTPVVTPNIGGQPLLLDAIAACVLGGTSIFGGRGTVVGVVAGALIVSLFSNTLRVVGIDPSSLDLMKGALVIAALVCDIGIVTARRRFLKESHP